MWFQNLSEPEEAGWFQESHDKPDKFGDLWAMTPKHKLLSPERENDIVLLSTGGFAPIHDGHIAMMEAAKIHMESKGFRVVGGYVSPGHDDYVVKVKNVAISAPERLALANRRLENHSWLMVDPWEAVGCTCSVNFTTVIDHLEKILNCRICYVVGSDNERFSLAFKNRGLLCIVRRTADVLPNPKYRGRNYSKYIPGVWRANNEPIPGSSTELRREFRFGGMKKNKLILRVDEASEMFLDRLLDILRDYYTEVIPVHVSDQKIPEGIPNLISLDQMLVSLFGNLGLSRNYMPGGYQKLGYINRPGTPPLEEQLKPFAGQEVSLFDDDVISGNTMRKASHLLEGVNCKVVSEHALTWSYAREVMDSRDFLPVPNGGLVVYGERVPYIYPYVCPYVRASILPEQAEEFSDRIRAAFWS